MLAQCPWQEYSKYTPSPFFKYNKKTYELLRCQRYKRQRMREKNDEKDIKKLKIENK